MVLSGILAAMPDTAAMAKRLEYELSGCYPESLASPHDRRPISRAKRPEGASLCDNPGCSIGDASLGPRSQRDNGASSGGDAVITTNAPPRHPVFKSGHLPSARPVSRAKRPEGASLCDNPRCSIGDASLVPRSQIHHYPPVLHPEPSARRVRRCVITPGVASEMQAWGQGAKEIMEPRAEATL